MTCPNCGAGRSATPFGICGICFNPMPTEARWVAIRDTYRKPEPSPFALFLEAGERFFTERPVARLAASACALSAAAVAFLTLIGAA